MNDKKINKKIQTVEFSHTTCENIKNKKLCNPYP